MISATFAPDYARGFRNPFRFSLRPGAGPIVGDVGENTWEEIDALEAGKNYGWPCYEGSDHEPGYSNRSRCSAEYANEGTSSAATQPAYDYAHANLGVGGAVIAGPVYPENAYPESYSGTIFLGDYVHGFVRRLAIDGQSHVTVVTDFSLKGWFGVDLEQAPDGSLVWVDPGNFGDGQGTIRKWIYTAPGSN